MKSARVLSIAVLMSVTGAAFADGPFHYPGDMQFVPGDRAKVVADLHRAERRGQISVGESGSGEGDQALFKQWRNKSRPDVGELDEAEDLGLISVGGGVPSETAAQEQAITDAGRHAAEQSKAAAK